MKKRKLEIEYIPTSELKPYEGNAKVHTSEQVQQIMGSIETFGFNDPIAVWKKNEIIEGHGRLLAAQELGLKEVPIIRLDKLTDEERRAYEQYNLKGFDPVRCEGYYEMPTIEPCDVIPTDLVGFNYVLSAKDFDAGVHFYIDDYQFERVWNEPAFYIEKMRPFQCCLTPDFSLYMDMSMSLKIWNTFRSRLIGQMCQDAGLNVIPTVSWAEDVTFDWCFDGLPKHATLSVSTLGVKRNKNSQKIWQEGMDAMIKKLRPKRLLVYGGALDYDYGAIEVIEYKNSITERMSGAGG